MPSSVESALAAKRTRDERSESPEHAGPGQAAADCESRNCKPKRQKEFAWMDSSDEDAEDGTIEPAQEVRQEVVPTSPAEVHSLAQLMQMMDSWKDQRGKILRLPLPELAEICQAAARVKFYDASSFADVVAAAKVHFRGHGVLDPGAIAGVVSGLADVNGYDQDLFEAALQALRRVGEKLQRPERQRILEAFQKVKHESKRGTLAELQQLEAQARYEDARQGVKARWQKPKASVAR
eukprot:TRINITY_DN116523_c0_g1_i1.p1 TRINITY_DN116523_c0_g1~~TRINITY_DN116523_c0_g1_i1.p1  ORF type:complete len:237 (+),score=69.82 TRINITY_DN116523_c0_g1_i1:114-824(+)